MFAERFLQLSPHNRIDSYARYEIYEITFYVIFDRSGRNLEFVSTPLNRRVNFPSEKRAEGVESLIKKSNYECHQTSEMAIIYESKVSDRRNTDTATRQDRALSLIETESSRKTLF